MPNPAPMDVSHQVPHSATTSDGTNIQLQGNIKYVSASCTLKVFEQSVIGTATATVTLPPVCEAIGRVFLIGAQGATITVADQDDSYHWSDASSDISVTDGECWLFISNGIAWASHKGSAETT